MEEVTSRTTHHISSSAQANLPVPSPDFEILEVKKPRQPGPIASSKPTKAGEKVLQPYITITKREKPPKPAMQISKTTTQLKGKQSMQPSIVGFMDHSTISMDPSAPLYYCRVD